MNRLNKQATPDEHQELNELLDTVFQMDQSDPQRSNAHICYKMLTDRQNDFIGTFLEESFWNAVSLEALHMAQIEAIKDNINDTLKNLKIALEAAKKTTNKEWESYIRGTLCYFLSDTEGLENEIPNAGGNTKTLQRLLEGLIKRGSVNYKDDY